MFPPWIQNARAGQADGRPLVAPPPNLAVYGPEPLYEQVAAYIKSLIGSGAWPPGGRLKSELVLAQDFSVSRGTLKKALASLAEEGLIVQVHGRGTFVAGRPQSEHPGLMRFVETLTAPEAVVETVQLSTFDTTMPAAVAAALESSSDAPVVKITYLRRAEDGPIALIVRWVRAELSEAATERTAGLRRIEAVAADAETAAALEVELGAPLQYLDEILHDSASGTAHEYCQIWSRPDRIALTFSLDAAPAEAPRLTLGTTPAPQEPAVP